MGGDRIDRLEAGLRLGAPLLWNDVGRPPEPPLPPAAALLAAAAEDDDDARLAAIEGELDYLVSVYPHARALAGLGPAAIRERMRSDPYPIPTPPDREGDFVRERWGRVLQVGWIEERAHGHLQDAAVRPRPWPTPGRAAGPAGRGPTPSSATPCTAG